MGYIENNNFKSNIHLNNSVIHLNFKGSSRLAKNFINFVNLWNTGCVYIFEHSVTHSSCLEYYETNIIDMGVSLSNAHIPIFCNVNKIEDSGVWIPPPTVYNENINDDSIVRISNKPTPIIFNESNIIKDVCLSNTVTHIAFDKTKFIISDVSVMWMMTFCHPHQMYLMELNHQTYCLILMKEMTLGLR